MMCARRLVAAFDLRIGAAPISLPDQLAALHADAFGRDAALGSPWSAAAFAALSDEACGSGAALVWAELFAAGRLCGAAVVRSISDEAELLTLCRAPSFRGLGAGSTLVGGLEAALRRRNVARLLLEVSEANAAARALYGQQGFREVGRRRGYYGKAVGSACDALILEKCLPDVE